MKFLIAFFLLFFSTTGFTQNVIDPNISTKEWLDSFEVNMKKVIGKEMNHFSVISDNGEKYTNNSLKGKVTLVNFWFEAGPPCVAEFDAINDLYEKFKSNKNFQILAFSYETPEAIKRIKEEYRLKFELLPVSDKEIRQLNFNYGFPTNLIIDQSEKVAHINVGGSTDKAKAMEYFSTTIIPEINKLLDKN
jgi:peroxiredoxin